MVVINIRISINDLRSMLYRQFYVSNQRMQWLHHERVNYLRQNEIYTFFNNSASECVSLTFPMLSTRYTSIKNACHSGKNVFDV